MRRAVILLVVMALVGCTGGLIPLPEGPPIGADGSGCEYYGVSEANSPALLMKYGPIQCELDRQGMPVYEVVSYREMFFHCNEYGIDIRNGRTERQPGDVGAFEISMEHAVPDGCVETYPDGSPARIFVWGTWLRGPPDDVVKHQQCHCLLGSLHSADVRPAY